MSPILKFSISKLGYVAILMKIEGKNIWPIFLRHFWPLLKTFLTNRGKNKDEDEKIGKMSSIFEFSISKLGCVALFIKIWEKCFFFEIFTLEGHTGTEINSGGGLLGVAILDAMPDMAVYTAWYSHCQFLLSPVYFGGIQLGPLMIHLCVWQKSWRNWESLITKS